LAAFDVATFMVSLDEPDKNQSFAESVGASFVLLSDEDKSNAENYGVLAFAGLYAKRVTFYIDDAGKIVRIDRDVETETHGQDVIRTLEELGFPKRP
jgi:peroxiredoxin